MERGTVLAYNAGTQKMAVAVDGDHCALFELAADYEVAPGHRLRGELESGLCFAVENLSSGEMMSVIPQGVHLSVDDAVRATGS